MAARAHVLAVDGAEDHPLNDAPLRVLFSCTGVGIMNRGIESFFREAFDNLHTLDGVEAWLLKGAGGATW